MLSGEEVGRGQEGPLPAGERHGREGPRRYRGLARADVALEEPEHRDGSREVVADRGDRGRLIRGEVDLVPHLPAEPGGDRVPDRHLGRVVDDHGPAALPHPRPAPADHAELQRQKLVEGEPAKGGVAALERGRVVRLLERLADEAEPELASNVSREVLRVGACRSIERRADGAPERRDTEAGREPVDRHDPPGVEEGRAIVRLELGVVERHPGPEAAQLAAHDDRVAGLEATLDEAAPEPGRIDGAGRILQAGDRPLDAPPERCLDSQLGDPYAGRDRLAVGDEEQLPEPAHLAEVLVAAGEVEEQVADTLDAQPPAAARQGRCPGQSRPADRARRAAERVRAEPRAAGGFDAWRCPGSAVEGRGPRFPPRPTRRR